jgi:proline dehydrogenase
MHDQGVQSILDYSAEGKYGEQDLDHTHSIILRTIEYAREHPGVPLAVFKPSGLGPSAIWTAVSAGQTLNAEQEKQWASAKERIRSLCAAAQQASIPLMFDAEESWMQKAMDDLCLEMMRTFNQERPIVFNTLQMYRHDRLEYLKELDSISARDGFHIGLKIVRGAYMEKERQRARERGIPSPIQPDKAATDRDYNVACAFIADRLDRYALVAGSHNEDSAQLLANLLTNHGQKGTDRVYFSQLYGMSDHISFNLASAGFQVVKYLPFGPIQEVMPYLIRRAEENTSVGGQSGRELQLISEELRRRKG